MASPTISILIPTRGDGDIGWVAHSIITQELIPGDEVLIITDGIIPGVGQVVEALGPPFRLVRGPATGDWGHSQLNHGLTLAKGDWIMGTDDDDGYLPRAIETVRNAVAQEPGKPHIFKFLSNDRSLVWNRGVGKRIVEGFIGGHNLVTPNIDGKRGTFTSRYRGDYDWITSVLDSYPRNDWVWREEILTRQRPQRLLLAWPCWKRSELWPARVEAMRQVRNDCRSDLTHSREEISFDQQKAWASSLDRDSNWAWVFTLRDGDSADYIGFAYLRLRDGKMTPTYGISPRHRGKGYARHIVQFALDAGMGDMWGDALESNEAILHVDFALGWKELSRADGVVQLHYPYPR